MHIFVHEAQCVVNRMFRVVLGHKMCATKSGLTTTVKYNHGDKIPQNDSNFLQVLQIDYFKPRCKVMSLSSDWVETPKAQKVSPMTHRSSSGQ